MKKLAMVAVTAVLAACAPPAQKTETPAAEGVALYALDCGRIHLTDADMYADDHAYKGQAKDLVDPCFLIRHPPKGDLLWDTGLPTAFADSPATFGVHEVTVPHRLTDQLTQLGLTPADIDYVSISHAHFDHAGNANLFTGSTWILDKDERDWMFRPEARKAADEFALYSGIENAKTTLIEGDGDYDVFGDGSVKIIQAPGHTPGHTVLLVTLASGPVLLTGDMWHIAESRAARRVPAFNTDRAQTLRSMDKVERVAAETHARVIRQHVPEDIAGLPAFPQPLR